MISGYSFYIPEQDYLKRYVWRRYTFDGLIGPTALVTYKGTDIILILLNDIPKLLDPKRNPDIYWKYTPVQGPIIKLVKMWTKSGFYKSMHLKEYLDAILSRTEVSK